MCSLEILALVLQALVRDSYHKLTDEQDVEWNYLAKYIKVIG